VAAFFKWNLNAPQPPSIAWTKEPPSPERITEILAGCDHLNENDKEKLKGQLHRLNWIGPVSVSANDLLKAAAKPEQKANQNEVDRAAEWLGARLAHGPVPSIICAREGDKAVGRMWPVLAIGANHDEHERRVLSRVKWWRETILKTKLGGQVSKAGFNGVWFFRLPTHAWPPTDADIAAAAWLECDSPEEAPTKKPGLYAYDSSASSPPSASSKKATMCGTMDAQASHVHERSLNGSSDPSPPSVVATTSFEEAEEAEGDQESTAYRMDSSPGFFTASPPTTTANHVDWENAF
jgi:hypothetical protein